MTDKGETGSGSDESEPRAETAKDELKAKMREALEKKNAQHHLSAGGGGRLKGPQAANGGQQRRVFRRKSG